MHEQRDLVDQSMIHYDTRKLFVDIAEKGSCKKIRPPAFKYLDVGGGFGVVCAGARPVFQSALQTAIQQARRDR